MGKIAFTVLTSKAINNKTIAPDVMSPPINPPPGALWPAKNKWNEKMITIKSTIFVIVCKIRSFVFKPVFFNVFPSCAKANHTVDSKRCDCQNSYFKQRVKTAEID